LILLLCFGTSCEGPAGPQGPAGGGGVTVSVTINGSVTGDDIKTAIDDAVAAALLAGGTNDGSEAAKAFTVSFTGFDLDDDLAMKALFTGIKDYWVHLDLSGLTGTTYRYYPLSVTTDKSKIRSITLSNTATAITDSATTTTGGAFLGFTGLESLTALELKTVGSYAFYNCAALASINMLAAEAIGNYAFYCTALTSVDLPEAETIGNYAFYGTALASVNLPEATTIGSYAFANCNALVSVDLPEAETIDTHAFQNCTALASVNLPAASSIGFGTFGISSSAVTTTAALTITLGAIPPTLGINMFSYVVSSKTVTVKAPNITSGTTGYGTVPANTTDNNWGNAFRGKGWNRDTNTYGTIGTVNSNITLVYQNP
jgi:hypothetical protein